MRIGALLRFSWLIPSVDLGLTYLYVYFATSRNVSIVESNK